MPWWAQFILDLAWPFTVVVTACILSYAAWRCSRDRLHTEVDLAKLRKEVGQRAGDRVEPLSARTPDQTHSRGNTTAGQECDACAWLFALIQSQEVYHAHKEQMAWLGAALWITAASFLLVQKPDFWNMYSQKWLLYTSIITVLAAGFGFVKFQFNRREQAAAYSNACINVATRWLNARPTPDELRPDPVEEGIQFPATVTAEVRCQLRGWRGFKGPRVSEYLTYFVMAVFATMVIVRAATV